MLRARTPSWCPSPKSSGGSGAGESCVTSVATPWPSSPHLGSPTSPSRSRRPCSSACCHAGDRPSRTTRASASSSGRPPSSGLSCSSPGTSRHPVAARHHRTAGPAAWPPGGRDDDGGAGFDAVAPLSARGPSVRLALRGLGRPHRWGTQQPRPFRGPSDLRHDRFRPHGAPRHRDTRGPSGIRLLRLRGDPRRAFQPAARGRGAGGAGRPAGGLRLPTVRALQPLGSRAGRPPPRAFRSRVQRFRGLDRPELGPTATVRATRLPDRNRAPEGRAPRGGRQPADPRRARAAGRSGGANPGERERRRPGALLPTVDGAAVRRAVRAREPARGGVHRHLWPLARGGSPRRRLRAADGAPSGVEADGPAAHDRRRADAARLSSGASSTARCGSWPC